MTRTLSAGCLCGAVTGTLGGEIVFGTNRPGMRVVLNSLTARAHGGRLPDHLQPSMHLFYGPRVIDVADALPKYVDGWGGPMLDPAS